MPVCDELHDTVKVMDGHEPDLPDTEPVTSYDGSFCSSFFSFFCTLAASTAPSLSLAPFTST